MPKVKTSSISLFQASSAGIEFGAAFRIYWLQAHQANVSYRAKFE